MKPIMSALLAALMLTGCHSFRTISLESGPDHPAAWAVYDYVNFGFNLKVERIDIDKSYATSPGDRRFPGQHYKIEVEPNVGTNAIYEREAVDAKVYFIKPDGSRLKRIESGVWSVHFVVEKGGTMQTIDQRWRIGSTGPALVLGGG